MAESLDFSASGTDMFKSGFFTGLMSFFSLFSTSGLNFAFAISAGDWYPFLIDFASNR